jgi:4-diphosphocytidyl-2-C-methyl-D-erythritol kinase
MTAARTAPAKINLALVVGDLRPDGKHELATVYERIGLADWVTVEPAASLTVEGFEADTLVWRALTTLAERAGVSPRWRVMLEKRIPVAAGLAGGSSDAAKALELANALLDDPLDADALHTVAATVGADVPFFLTNGPQLGRGDGTTLSPLELPRAYWVVILLPKGAVKAATADVYHAFDERGGPAGFATRHAELVNALAKVERPSDLASLPPNDLASSPHAAELVAAGAFRADVSGAGPAVYALFEDKELAGRVAADFAHLGETWLSAPSW